MNTLNFFTGFGIGDGFRRSKLKEDEIKQGKNYYLSFPFLVNEELSLMGVSSTLISCIPHTGVRIFTHVLSGASILLSVPTGLFLACVKHSHYDVFVSTCKQCPIRSFLITKLPDRLSNRTIRVVHFLADYAGDMIQAAIVVQGIALIVLGKTFFARGLLISLAYGVLDSHNWIPRKVSLFIETYSPLIGAIGAFYTGTWFNQAYAVLQLATSLFPSFEVLLQKKLDDSLSSSLNGLSKAPLIKEIDQGFSGAKDLTYQEIKDVITATCDRGYKINVPHCTNFVKTPDLPKDDDFKKLLQFFELIDWTQKFNVIKTKLSKEDHFIGFLSEKYMNIPQEKLKKNIDFYIEDLAKKENTSKEKYVAQWLNKQMAALVNVLTGSKRGMGLQGDLQDAIKICPKVIAYLQQIKENLSDQIEYEDALLKLALEAGNYCNRGIKRAFSEMQSQIIYKKSSNVQHEERDWIKQYELQFLQSLQDFRYEILLAMYQKNNIEWLSNETFQDTHAFDAYRKFFAFGFYPFTEYERKNFSIADSLLWKARFSKYLEEMYATYQTGLFDKIEKNGGEREYILHKIIEQNSHLQDSEKEELSNWYTDMECTGNEKEITRKSRLLLLITMGVLQPKQSDIGIKIEKNR